MITGQQRPSRGYYPHNFVLQFFCIYWADVFVYKVFKSDLFEFFNGKIHAFIIGIGTIDFFIARIKTCRLSEYGRFFSELGVLIVKMEMLVEIVDPAKIRFFR